MRLSLHCHGMEHGLQRPVGLLNLVPECGDIDTMDVQINDGSSLPHEALWFGGVVDFVDQRRQLAEGGLAVCHGDMALLPQVLLDEGEVELVAAIQCFLDGLEERSQVGEFMAEGGDARVDGLEGANEAGQRGSDLLCVGVVSGGGLLIGGGINLQRLRPGSRPPLRQRSRADPL